jgi:hypothetical protein
VLPTDLPTLRDRLGELAEVFERKAPSEKALKVWYDVLREFPCEVVAGVLLGWPKLHTKFPAPADVRKIVGESLSFERERQAAKENQPFYPGVGGQQAQQFIASIREILKRPKWTPREHWERLLERSAPHSLGHRFAAEALKKIGARSLRREPGQDDEEAAVVGE